MERRHLDVWRPEAIAALIVPKSDLRSQFLDPFCARGPLPITRFRAHVTSRNRPNTGRSVSHQRAS